jgi:hypothetical protein
MSFLRNIICQLGNPTGPPLNFNTYQADTSSILRVSISSNTNFYQPGVGGLTALDLAPQVAEPGWIQPALDTFQYMGNPDYVHGALQVRVKNNVFGAAISDHALPRLRVYSPTTTFSYGIVGSYVMDPSAATVVEEVVFSGAWIDPAPIANPSYQVVFETSDPVANVGDLRAESVSFMSAIAVTRRTVYGP